MHVICAVQPRSLDLSPSKQRLSLQLEATTPHQVTPLGFEYVEVEGDKSAMAEWIGAGVDELPLRRVSWSPCIANVAAPSAPSSAANRGSYDACWRNSRLVV